MRVKKVNRYYCDFCKKSGCNRYHIEKHEKHCTMNPNRKCRMCDELEVEQKPLSQLMAMLPDAPTGEIDWDEITPVTKEVLQRLRDVAAGCPACMLAAIRQRGVAAFAGFHYKEEAQRIFQDKDNLRYE